MQRSLHLTGSWLSIWLAHTAYGLPFAIFLLRNFFAELPRELFEAAKIDGHSDLGIFTGIVLPLSVPALASLGIFQFVWVWNDLMNALILLQDQKKFPLTVAIQSLLGHYGSEWNLLAAGAFVSMSIPLLVFFLLQRYFVRGITAGAVKG
jgi:alpha-glucoside transport system permease protein